ncbi:MAG: MarR family transcriptional regulator, partial [Burkholderiaceae bacterium]
FGLSAVKLCAMPMSEAYDYQAAPGYLMRRAHQLAVAIFATETASFDLTPVQFAMLNALMDEPGEDQITLASKVAFDAATSGAVIARLENKGLLRRDADPQDKRRKLLRLTPAGEAMVVQMKAAVAQVQTQITSPLSATETQDLNRLLVKLVAGHESRILVQK